MNILSAVLLVVFAAIGVCAVVRELSMRLFTDKTAYSILLITPVDNADNAEFVLRSAAAKLRWGRGCRSCAVCLDAELDDETRRICETVCREYGFLKLMTKEELMRRLYP